VLRTPAARVFEVLSDKVNAVIGYSQAGSKFVFGDQLGGGPMAVFRVSGAADHHLHLQPVRDPLLPGRHASAGEVPWRW
jgi:hypothetical protein